ncbi:hypothetical protein GCM10009641_19550 [Mycobacterium cookii]|uniref:Uncharacterized protein n=1 Tax=Mycobacterium cookii TaxID=1775 RepID=A0A7I7L146_9MYCO|nr:hypothetical protein [Mycobacterium cookii]BBX47757.1 hypothetical protein MCOO_37720 [Mycobacterium cookii]
MTTAEQPPESLLSAMAKARIPADNHPFIRRVANAIGIAEYRAVLSSDKPYIVAKRRDGQPDLHIYHGYTTGFTTEQEINGVADSGTGRGPSSRTGTWYVEHPKNQVRLGGKRSGDVRREGSFCSCGMQRSLTGVCVNCD